MNWTGRCVCKLRINFLDTFGLAIHTRVVGAVAGLNPACLMMWPALFVWINFNILLFSARLVKIRYKGTKRDVCVASTVVGILHTLSVLPVALFLSSSRLKCAPPCEGKCPFFPVKFSVYFARSYHTIKWSRLDHVVGPFFLNWSRHSVEWSVTFGPKCSNPFSLSVAVVVFWGGTIRGARYTKIRFVSRNFYPVQEWLRTILPHV